MMYDKKHVSSFLISVFFLSFCAISQHAYHENESHFLYKSDREDFSLGIKALFQQNNEYKYEEKKHSFDMSIPRARLKIFGRAFNPKLSYFFQTQFENDYDREEGSYTSPGSHHLKDFYVNYGHIPKALHFRFGKFKAPFGRHYLLSGAQMRFAPLSIAQERFSITDDNRDLGFMIHSGYSRPFEYAFALMTNGISARFGYNHGGIDGFEYVDFKGGDARFGAAVSGFYHTDYKTFTKKDYRLTADGIFKMKNFSANADFFYQRQEDKNAYGADVDLGYLANRQFEPAFHFGWVYETSHAYEGTFGFNYYVHGHHLKAQAYVGGQFRSQKFEPDATIAGVQLQFAI